MNESWNVLFILVIYISGSKRTVRHFRRSTKRLMELHTSICRGVRRRFFACRNVRSPDTIVLLLEVVVVVAVVGYTMCSLSVLYDGYRKIQEPCFVTVRDSTSGLRTLRSLGRF